MPTPFQSPFNICLVIFVLCVITYLHYHGNAVSYHNPPPNNCHVYPRHGRHHLYTIHCAKQKPHTLGIAVRVSTIPITAACLISTSTDSTFP